MSERLDLAYQWEQFARHKNILGKDCACHLCEQQRCIVELESDNARLAAELAGVREKAQNFLDWTVKEAGHQRIRCTQGHPCACGLSKVQVELAAALARLKGGA